MVVARVVRKFLPALFAAYLGRKAFGISSQSQDVCLPGVSASGCSQLQLSLGAGHPPWFVRVAVARASKTVIVSNTDNVSFVELQGDLALHSSVQLARTFLKEVSDVELALATLDRRMYPSTRELTTAITKLREDQGASPVGCKVRITDVKVELKQLHSDVLTTATYLKETKKEVEVVDAQLKQVLVSIKRVDNKKTEDSSVCEKREATDKMMLTMLTGDMQQMRQMGRTVQTVRTRTVSPPFQASLLGLPANTSSGVFAAHADRTGHVQELIGNARAASLQMHDCLKAHAPASLLEHDVDTTAADSDLDVLGEASNVSPTNSQPQMGLPTDPRAPTLETEPDHCMIDRETLEETWTEAYEEITREVESYEILVDDTSCADAVESEYQEKFQVLQVKERELSHKVSIAIGKVQVLRPQLKDLKRARKKLKKRLVVIEQECEALEKTKETLEVTEEVIIKMDECAGLDSSAFELPVWVGQWISVDLSEDLSVFDADAQMNRACSATFGDGVRAAEVSDIDTRSIRKMPKRNEASLPVMPTCPMCGTRLARVCWDAGAKFNREKRRRDCTPGMRAILCVKR